MTNSDGQKPGKVWRPWRLRTRLAVALLALFVPLSALIIVTHFETRDDQREARVQSIKSLNDTIAAVLDGFTKDLDAFTLSISITTADATGGDVTQIRQESFGPYLQHLLDAYGILRAIFLTDTSGKVIAAQSAASASTGVDLSSRPYVQALQAGALTTWSGALTGIETGQTTITFGRAITDPSGQPFAYLIAAFYADQLATRLPEGLPAGANVGLMDQNGLLLFSSQEGRPPPGTEVRESPVFSAALREGEATVEDGLTPVDGDHRYGAFKRLNETRWVVGLTRPASLVDGPLESRFRRDLLIISSLLLGSFIATLFIASRLARPLSTLADAAAAIARGDRPVMPITAADAEVDELVSAMAIMSRAVEEREERLREQARVLERLERVGQAIATELDYRQAVSSVTQAGYEITAAEGATLLLRRRDKPEWDWDTPSFAGACDTLPFNEGDPFLAQALSGRILAISDVLELASVTETPVFSAERSLSVRALLGIPILARTGEMVGGLFLFHSQPGRLTDYDQRLAIGLARAPASSLRTRGSTARRRKCRNSCAP